MNRLLTIVDSKYQRLEYLESTGTQYIDTGYVANPNTKIKTKLKIISYNHEYNAIFGARTSNHSTDTFLFIRNGASADVTRFEADGNLTTVVNLSLNVLADIEIGQNKLTCNGTDYTINMSVIVPNNKNLFLFGLNENGQLDTIYGSASTRIYSFKIYDNGTLVRNFVPVLRKSDNELGMLDLVEGKFYTNAGTGKFTANLDTMYAIIQGSPTQSPYGVFSGFSASNYLQVQNSLDLTKSWEIQLEFTTGNDISSEQFILADTQNPSPIGFGIFTNSQFVVYYMNTQGLGKKS